VPLYLLLFKLYRIVFRSKIVAVKCVLFHGDKILLIKNSYGSKLWILPGGVVKRNESKRDAVIREIREEIGIAINNPRECGSLFHDEENKKNTTWVFSTDVSSDQIEIDNLEIEEAKWFSRDKLPQQKAASLTESLALANSP